MDEAGARELSEKCSQAALVITDVGHVFDEAIQKVLQEKVPHVRRLAYTEHDSRIGFDAAQILNFELDGVYQAQ